MLVYVAGPYRAETLEGVGRNVALASAVAQESARMSSGSFINPWRTENPDCERCKPP